MCDQEVVDRPFDAWLPESYIEKYQLLLGDIVAKTNGFNPVAVTKSPATTLVLVGSNAFRIRPHIDKVMPAYLWFVLTEKSKGFRERNQKITRPELEAVEIILPDPADQQEWLRQFTKLKVQEQDLLASL